MQKFKFNSKNIRVLYDRYKKDFCDEWLDKQKFQNWLSENGYKKGAIFTRRDRTLKFSPDNCILSNRKEFHKSNLQYKFLCNTDIKEGDRFERLLVIGPPFSLHYKIGVVCQCDCGNIIATNTISLKNKDSMSCGCYHMDISRERINNGEMKRTLIEKYGVENYSYHPDFKEKVKETSLKKYGVDNYTKTEKFRKNSSLKNTKIFFNGETIKDVCERTGYSYLEVCHLTNKFGDSFILKMKKNYSSIESIIHSILEDLNVKYEKQKKLGNIFPDIIIEDNKLVIECNGIYWHSDKVLEKTNHHKLRKDYIKKLGYKTLFFNEDEILYNQEIVKSIIKNKIGQSERIFARKCKIVKLDKTTRKEFFKQNHLMGNGSGDAYGLEYEGRLVCAMQIRNKEEFIEIARFCPALGLNIVGGFTKILSYIEKIYKRDIITFIDRRYGDGEYLTSLGFELKTKFLSFRWGKKTITSHRMKFPGNSGYEQGWNKIWDCGQYKYVKEHKE